MSRKEVIFRFLVYFQIITSPPFILKNLSMREGFVWPNLHHNLLGYDHNQL